VEPAELLVPVAGVDAALEYNLWEYLKGKTAKSSVALPVGKKNNS